MGQKVELEHKGAVAHIVLNRPDKLNAIDADCLELLAKHVADIESDPAVRVVVVSGRGRAFCAGADLDSVGALASDPPAFAAFMDTWHAAYTALAQCSKPTIAMVHGVALAGGFELVQVCDFCVVADDARIGDQHASFGLFPGGGSTQRLPRLLGTRRALWLLMSGEWISGQEAYDIGLANAVVPFDQLAGRVEDMARLLAGRSPAASAAIKRAVQLGEGRDVETALAAERPIALAHMASEDARIGLEAFRTRSTPTFVGR
jgi:enoyl-CoA hydratase/carnithine racemase